MNDRERWDRLAERGEHRGPKRVVDAVEAALSGRPGRVSRGLRPLAIAAAIVFVAAVGAAALQDDQTTVSSDGEALFATTTTTAPAATTTAPTTTATTAAVSAVGPPSTTAPPPTTSTSAPGPRFTAPPAAWISGTSGEVEMEQGSYCWAQGDQMASLCADTIGPGEQTPSLAVDANSTLSVRWDTEGRDASAPSTVDLSMRPVDGSEPPVERRLDTTNPTSFVVDVEPGSYYAVVFTVWPEGDSSNVVRLDVS